MNSILVSLRKFTYRGAFDGYEEKTVIAHAYFAAKGSPEGFSVYFYRLGVEGEFYLFKLVEGIIEIDGGTVVKDTE